MKKLLSKVHSPRSFSSYSSFIHNTNRFQSSMKYHKISHQVISGLDCAVVAPTSKQADSLVIWLHGLGDTYDGFSQVMQMCLPENTMSILPNAPERAITINGGYVMTGWYDIYSLDRELMKKSEDVKGIKHSTELINQLIESQLEKFPSKRIILGGFSQGGAMSIIVGCQSKHKLGGIICCSGYVTMRSQNETPAALVSPENKDTPFYIFHGDSDDMVNYESYASQSFDWLEQSKTITQRKIYRYQGHEVSEEEMVDLRKTFETLLK